MGRAMCQLFKGGNKCDLFRKIIRRFGNHINYNNQLLLVYENKRDAFRWTGARRPVPRPWIRSAKFGGNVVMSMGTQ